jgi:hypothetical protein
VAVEQCCNGSLSSIPKRGSCRPTPARWDMDELLTLNEAAALFWPDGPLTVTSLRNAIRNHQLAFVPHCREASQDEGRYLADVGMQGGPSDERRRKHLEGPAMPQGE